jgi:hypothetical protein
MIPDVEMHFDLKSMWRWVAVATMWTIEHHMVQPCSAHLQPVSIETILAGKQLAKNQFFTATACVEGTVTAHPSVPSPPK